MPSAKSRSLTTSLAISAGSSRHCSEAVVSFRPFHSVVNSVVFIV